jgi:hypothetical protein
MYRQLPWLSHLLTRLGSSLPAQVFLFLVTLTVLSLFLDSLVQSFL